jgi:hypothetical protein
VPVVICRHNQGSNEFRKTFFIMVCEAFCRGLQNSPPFVEYNLVDLQITIIFVMYVLFIVMVDATCSGYIMVFALCGATMSLFN